MKGKMVVLRDTREQKGWSWAASKYVEATEAASLPTGDYTVRGLEKLVVVERKGTSGELMGNLFQKRFWAELERLEEYRWPFVVCEFTLADVLAYPAGSGVPPARWRKLRGRGDTFLRKVTEAQMRHRARFVFAGRHGKEAALCIFKRAVELCQKEP